jgi:hypothetical protein
MAHLSLEDIYPADVAEYGHMRVGMTDRYAREHRFVEGMTFGEFRVLTSELLRDEAVQVEISAQLSALPEDYDPWLWQIERRRAARLRYGDSLNDD